MTQWAFSFCGYSFVLTTTQIKVYRDSLMHLDQPLGEIYWSEMTFINNLAQRTNYFQVGTESFLGYLILNHTEIDVVMVDIEQQLDRIYTIHQISSYW